MNKIIRALALVCASLSFASVNAEGVTKEHIKGIDEQVQDIKKDVLEISAELSLLEEKLLFPSSTQISIFVSLDKGAGFTPDAIKIDMDDKDIASHIYSFREVDALKKGGVQRIYTGNVRTGEHDIEVTVTGKNGGNKKSDTSETSIRKGVGPQFVEIRLTDAGVVFSDW